ncbi:MAG: amidohydrolase [Candidatus Eisenbacteria bacterium]|nr:amidohydrolase [Candidatus Eisenbacteria bacterium]
MEAASDATELRRKLHRAAELSGGEAHTAEIVREYLSALAPKAIVTGLGGHGVAAVYDGAGSGPRVMVRCELDALPIPEGTDRGDASETLGVSHKCGHDGHMAIVASLAERLHEKPPARGSVVLLFQPAEETGAGARLVLDDPAFSEIRPDVALALHNVPGYPLGSVLLRDGIFASTARSLSVELDGRTSHAAEPDRGLSPAPALAKILSTWPAVRHSVMSMAFVTVVHARLGEPALGTSPGKAIAIATLRAQSNGVMERLAERCQYLAERIAEAHGLSARSEWLEEFPCTESDPSVNRIIEGAALDAGLTVEHLARPFPWTDDFGHFTEEIGGAMFGLGSGERNASLHHPDYVFPEELIPIGADLFRRTVDYALSMGRIGR